MDTYARRRLIAIFIAGIAVAGAALLYIWVAFTLHVVSTDPSGSTIPSTQQTVSVQFNQPLIDAQVTSISPDIGYSSSVKDATFTVKLGDTLSEGTVLTLDISAKSARATSDIHLSFTSAYVNFNQLSEAEQTQQIDSSDISNAYPMAGLVPRIDLGAPYYISYGEPARGSVSASLIISDSTPNGRVAALQWIRDQGYDPTTLNIHYDEYVNPLTSMGGGDE